METHARELGSFCRIQYTTHRSQRTQRTHCTHRTQEGRKALCGQNFYEPSALDFWRGFPLYSLDEYRYLRCVRD